MYICDTIVAVSTPPGNGGIAIVRISGACAAEIADILFKPLKNGGFKSHRFYFGFISDPKTSELIDEIMLVLMRAPHSYTREDVVELHCHGGMLIVDRVLGLVLSCGARLADPGEFTRRAFLNGRIDLIQAEAVMDIICSQTTGALKLAQSQHGGALSHRFEEIQEYLLRALATVEAYIDFPEDDLGEADLNLIKTPIDSALISINVLLRGFDSGRILREGVSALIVGKPNAGKSSLLNRLLNENRAIVTHLPGTTRDIIEEVLNLDGLPVRLLDTAGIRDTDDIAEKEGISRALGYISQADVVLFVMDVSRSFEKEDMMILDALIDSNVIAVLNKSDLPPLLNLPDSFACMNRITISATNGDGITELKELLHNEFSSDAELDSRQCAFISRTRHRDALISAHLTLTRCSDALAAGPALELLAVDLRGALSVIGTVTGSTTTDDVLDMIFSSFCIGK